MVYIENWDEYQRAAEELYEASPFHTRYVSSYRHSDGKLVLKVTDDRTCLKYATSQLTDLKKFDRLNRSLMSKIQQKKVSVSEAMDVDDQGPIQPASSKSSATPDTTVKPAGLQPASSNKGGKKGKKGRR